MFLSLSSSGKGENRQDIIEQLNKSQKIWDLMSGGLCGKLFDLGKNYFSFSLPPPPQFLKVRRSTEYRGINLKGSSSDDRCRKQCCSY